MNNIAEMGSVESILEQARSIVIMNSEVFSDLFTNGSKSHVFFCTLSKKDQDTLSIAGLIDAML